MSRKVLYALVLILIVSFCIAGYEFYVIERQSVAIRMQRALIESQSSSIEEMSARILTLESENQELTWTIQTKDQMIEEFRIQVKELESALENASHWPDLKTLKTFLREDRTNQHPYVEGSYECEEFALDLQKAAYKKGFFLSVQYSIVVLEEQGWRYKKTTEAHVCNLAFVIDENAFYIVEAQTDGIAFLSYAD